jgi:hypothetical protein
MLLHVLLEELGSRCGVSTTRDLKTIARRVEGEGESFLTITLPQFCKDLEKGLEQGWVSDDMWIGFRRTHAGLPLFLGGFLRLIFNSTDGRLLANASAESVYAVRQTCLFFSKIELECTEKRVTQAFRTFVQTESEVRDADLNWSTDSRDRFDRVSRLLWSNLFSRVDNQIYASGVLPKHGPGKTADRLDGNAKYRQNLWPTRLERVFPAREVLIPNEHPMHLPVLDAVTDLSPGEELPVKVISVPKTLKTPRMIAIEPTAMQYMQQGILEVLNAEIRNDDFARNLVCSDSQLPNRELAKMGSFDGSLATLDLSEASDRVSNQHVRRLLRNHRLLFEGVDATRSRKAAVRGKTIRLAKFASMGSALCFPMEALVFCTVVFMGIERCAAETGSWPHLVPGDDLDAAWGRARHLTKKDVESLLGRVRVYGDDIIVPTEYAATVIEELESFGFKVNRHKSFLNYRSRFRESCGAEYFRGVDVSVVRCRKVLPKSRQDVPQLVSSVELRNHLFHRGLLRSTEWMDSRIERLIPFPFVEWAWSDKAQAHESTSPLLGRHGYGPCQAERHDPLLHRPLVKGAVVVSKPPISRLDGSGALLKFFLKRGDKPFEKDHLERTGRPDSARIKIRWAPFR